MQEIEGGEEGKFHAPAKEAETVRTRGGFGGSLQRGLERVREGQQMLSPYLSQEWRCKTSAP